MNENQRRQTTKGTYDFPVVRKGIQSDKLAAGIWMCRSQGAPLLVMDVEGTDGRERGEDQVSLDLLVARRIA